MVDKEIPLTNNQNLEYLDLMLAQFTDEDITKYSDVIRQLRKVMFRNKLIYVVGHYARLDKVVSAIQNSQKIVGNDGDNDLKN